MKTKFLALFLCLTPVIANASIPYSAEQITDISEYNSDVNGNNNQSFASEKRFYIGGGYNYSMWNDFSDDLNNTISGENTSGFDAQIGVRVNDTFRIEANYYDLNAKWNSFELSGQTVFVNGIIDARIDSMYRMVRQQTLVPYIGAGIGMSWNSVNNNVQTEDKVSPTLAALAGISIEFNPTFNLDFGYRYFYMMSPKFDVINDFAPVAHQLRVGARVNF